MGVDDAVPVGIIMGIGCFCPVACLVKVNRPGLSEAVMVTLRETPGGSLPSGQMCHFQPKAAKTKLPTVVGLITLVTATIFNWYWVWGLMFLYWAVLSVVVGQVFVVQTVRRDESPYLFWSVSAMWAILAILVIVTDLFPGVALWLGDANG